LTLAYLLVWAWEEHKIQSEFNRKSPQKRLVILIVGLSLEANFQAQFLAVNSN